jgi:hypothetical protein
MRGLAASYPDQDILDQAMAYDPTDVRQSAAFSYFNYIIIMLTALLQLLHPTSPSRDLSRDRQAAKRLRRCPSLPERTVSRAH